MRPGLDRPRVFYGWIIVAVSFYGCTIMSGVLYSFGVFLKPIAEDMSWSRADVSGVYSLCQLIRGVSYVIMGWISDRYGPRWVVAIGGLLMGVSMAFSALMNSLWQFYLFYGILAGIGMSAFYVPLSAVVARWFVKKQGLALGIFGAGVGIGSFVLSPVAQYVILQYGWRLAYWVLAFLALSTLLTVPSFRSNPEEMHVLPFGQGQMAPCNHSLQSVGGTVKRNLVEAIKTRVFVLMFAAYLLFNVALQVVMVHMVAFATDVGIAEIVAAGALGFIGGTNAVGRIVMGGISDRIGSNTTLLISVAVSAVMIPVLMLAKTGLVLYVFALAFGFAYGGSVASTTRFSSELFGVKAMGQVFGAITLGANIGGAIGAYGAGYIFDITSSYYLAFGLSAATFVLSFIFTALVGYSQRHAQESVRYVSEQ